MLTLFVMSSQIYGQSIVINEFMSANNLTIEDGYGNSSDWIEIYNRDTIAINLKDYFLSDKPDNMFKWRFPEIILKPNDFLLVFASKSNEFESLSQDTNVYANFKISADGEKLFLSNQSGELIHSTLAVSLNGDQSYGRESDGSNTWNYFDFASPGRSNNQSNSLSFSHNRGYYTEPITLTIESENEDSVYYTFDGNEPTTTSTLYTSPFQLGYLDTCPNYFSEIPTTQKIAKWQPPREIVTKLHTLRCRSYHNKEPSSQIYSQTYFIESDVMEHYSMPLISLITPPKGLFDDSIGIYVPGIDARPNDSWTGNFFKRGIEWEKPVHIEYFETDGNVGFYQNAGLRIHGNYSRRLPQKSLRLCARRKYGNKYFKYQLLPQKNVSEYRRFILRSPFSDYKGAFIDAFIHNVMRDLDIEVQDYRPVIVFINGEYWGIHNLRDFIDENYLSALYKGIDKDKINILYNNSGFADGRKLYIDQLINYININILHYKKGIIEGTNFYYNQLIYYIKSHDLSVQDNYEYVKMKIDMNNYIEYMLIEMFCGNNDWPGHNIRYWQPDNNGKWRWILNDLDRGFQHSKLNMFPFATAMDGPGHPNPPWSTLLFRKLLENAEFKKEFVCIGVKLLKTTFSEDSMMNKIYEFEQLYEPEMEEYIARWNFPRETVQDWKVGMGSIRDFAQNRPTYFKKHMMNFFEIDNIDEYCKNNLSDSTTDTYPGVESIIISLISDNGFLKIQLPNAVNLEGQVLIYNMAGKIVYSKEVSSEVNYILIKAESLSKGLFLVSVHLNNIYFSSKTILN